MVISDNAGQPAYETAALHHDSVTRLLAALGYSKLASRQASRLSRTLRVDARSAPVSTSGLARSTLFGPPTGELLRPAASEKGLQQRSNRSADSDAAATGNAFGDGPTYETLQQVVPEWYEMHNAHCIGCVIPLLIGVNATFASHSRGVICRTCGTLTPTAEPDVTSRRGYRSRAVRERARAEEVSADVRRVQESEAKAQKRKRVAEFPEAAVTTLAQRQAELKRAAKLSKRAVTMGADQKEGPASSAPDGADVHHDPKAKPTPSDKEGRTPNVSSQYLTSAAPRVKASSSTALSLQAAPRIVAVKAHADRSPSTSSSRFAASSSPSPLHRSKPPSSSAKSHKDELRQLLDAKRKQKSHSANESKPSSGLQKFLGSL